MTNQEIENKMFRLARVERQATNEFLCMMNLAEMRKLHLQLGYSSLFDWLTKKFGYSEGAAMRRIQAARLLRVVPEVAAKLANGQINLTTLAKAQSVIRAQEKVTGRKLSNSAKAAALEKIKNQSSVQAEQTLFHLFPEAAPEMKTERFTQTANGVRVHTDLPSETQKDLQRIKALLSHSLPNADFAAVISHLAKDFLKRHDPLLKANQQPDNKKAELARLPARKPLSEPPQIAIGADTSAAAKRRVTQKAVPRPVRRAVIHQAGARCQFKDPISGRVCGSTHQLQIDHIVPRSTGGGNGPDNLRCLCRAHNIFMAETILGPKCANQWRIDGT